MIYRIKNITDLGIAPQDIYVADIPGLQSIKIRPGQILDLERRATRNQLLDSSHIKTHVNAGRATIDVAGTGFTPDERFFVDAYLSSGIVEVATSDDSPLIVTSPASMLDRFGRERVSTPHLVFESHLTFSELPNLWGNLTDGYGSITYLSDEAAVELEVTTVDGDSAIRQTHQHFNYHPGLSYLIMMTGVLGEGKTNVTQRIGYFSDDDGLFFQQADGILSVVRRSSTSGLPVDNITVQASWNLDTLDGYGASGIALDPTKTQIFTMDLSWLGVGGVRYGVVVGQQIVHVHEEVMSNIIDSAYMRTAVLPLRYEIENTGTASSSTTMKAICNSILREGEGDLVQTSRSVNTGTTSKNVTAVEFESILALRLQDDFQHARFQLDTFSLHFSSTSDVLIEIVKNPTLTGASWSTASGTIVEVDTAATDISGGEVLYSEYVKGPQHRSPIDIISGAKEIITTNVDGTKDIVAIRAITLSGNTNIAAGLNFSEIF